MKKLLVLFLFLSLLLSGCGGKQTADTQQAPASAEPPAADQTTSAAPEGSYDPFIDYVSPILDESFKGCYDIKADYENHGIMIKVWMDGLAARTREAQAGDEEAKKLWLQIKESFTKYSDSFQSMVRTLGIADDPAVVLDLVSDENQDELLAYFTVGFCVIDNVKVN